MLLRKEAARLVERPYAPSEAQPYKSTVDDFLKECFTLYRLPGAQRRKRTSGDKRLYLGFSKFWRRIEGQGPLHRLETRQNDSLTRMTRATYPTRAWIPTILADSRKLSFVRRAQSGKSG
jgi:hypothetical protein